MSPFRDLLPETFPVGRHQTHVSVHSCNGTQPFRDLLLETFSVGRHHLSAFSCQHVAVTAHHRSEIFPEDVLCRNGM